MDQAPLSYLVPGIRLTVAALQQAGFEVADAGIGTEEDKNQPFVVVVTTGDMLCYEADTLVKFLKRNDIQTSQVGDSSGVQIQASYDPTEGSAILEIIGLRDFMLPDVLVFPEEAKRDVN